MLQTLIIFAIVFCSILALRRSWKIAARWGLVVAIVTTGLILCANAFTFWYGVLPKAETAVRNLGGPTDPHLLKAIAVPLAILIYVVLGTAFRQLLLAYVAQRKLKFVLGFAGLYSLTQLFLFVADPGAADLLRRAATAKKQVRESLVTDGAQSHNPGPSSAPRNPVDTKNAADRTVRKGQPGGSIHTVQEKEVNMLPGSRIADRQNDKPASGQPIEADRLLATSNPESNVASRMTLSAGPEQTGPKPEEYSHPSRKQIDPPLRGSPPPTVALVVDAVGFGGGDIASDALQGLLAVPGKMRIIAGSPSSVNADGGLWASLSGERAVRSLARFHADYLLVDRLNIVFRRNPEIDADLITCEMSTTARLVDRSGMVVRSVFLPVAGPGFTRGQAFESAIENTARRLTSTLLVDLPKEDPAGAGSR